MLKKNVLLYITTGVILLNNFKKENRNIDAAAKLGWGQKYNNQNPYLGMVKYDEDKEYVGLNKELFYDLNKIRVSQFTKRYNDPLGNTNDILHQHYNKKVLNLLDGDKITGIQFRIHAGTKSFGGDDSGNQDFSTPSNFKSDNYIIKIGNMKLDSKLEADYQKNIDKCSDIFTVKKGVEWKAEEWPFGKVPENDYGPILKFDTPIIYTGDDILIEINYSDKESDGKIGTSAEGLVFKSTIEESTILKSIFRRKSNKLKEYQDSIKKIKKNYDKWKDSYRVYFNSTNKEPIYANENQKEGDKVLNDAVLDIQFEVERK